jgi:iron-sulfur cluster assembly accessory protein
MTVDVTESAQDHLAGILKSQDKQAVRFGIKGGGCAGFEYDWQLINKDEIEELDDIIIENENLTFVLDHVSMMYIMGSTVDYKKDIFGAMLTVDNPLAKSSCGCGTSISIDTSF